MKKLMQLLLLCLATVPATAQTEKSNVLIYTLDGKVDTLLLNNVRDIYHSRRDVNGVEQSDISTLRLRTVGGERVYPLTEIDHVVMPKSRRVVSFMGTAIPESETAGARQFTSVAGDFPGSVGDPYIYKWVTGDYIYLSSGDRSRNVENPYGSLSDHDKYRTERGHFEFASDTLVADQYVIYYSGTNRGDNANPIPFNKVKILDVQTQEMPNNSDHLGASGDCGWAVAVRQSNSNYLFELNHEVAVLCFIPRVDSLKTIVLKDIAVKSANGNTLAGRYTLSPTGITLDESTGSDSIFLGLGGKDYAYPFHVPNNKERPLGVEWEKTPQDSVAAYMVIAPQASSTPLKVYYHVYDTKSKVDTVQMKELTAASIEKAKLYPITNKLDPSLFFMAFTDSVKGASGNVKWTFGAPARMYGSVNMLYSGIETGIEWTNDRDFSTLLGHESLTASMADRSFSTLSGNVQFKPYYYRSYAVFNGKTFYGEVKKYGLEREAINMGTNDGLKWSSINLGSVTSEDIGDHYAWGETETKEVYTLATYDPLGDGTGVYDNIGSDISGNPQFDAATKIWRGCWRMPTQAEIQRLRNNSNWSKTSQNGVEGYLVTSKTWSDSTIFLPFEGGNHCHWAATEHTSDMSRAYDWYDSNSGSGNYNYKYYGRTIRPVFESNIEKNGQYLFIRSDQISYSADHTSTDLYGTMRGLDDVVTNVTQGFVIGETQDVTLESGATLQEEVHQTAADNGSYCIHLTEEQMSDMTLGATYYVRAYLTYAGETFYGAPLTMDAMTITADSTNWQVGMDQARLCSTTSGIPETAMSSVDIGFVVGTTPEVGFADADTVIVCDSTVNGKFVCEFKNMEFKQYYYRAFVRQGGRHFFSEPKMLGLDFVDLGLPSGLLWANINVGSQTPSDKGDYYAWGETKPQAGKRYHLDDYDPMSNGKGAYDNIGTDINGTLYDAAQVNWQGPWRMPTKADVQELYANCTVTLTELNGNYVWKFKSNINDSVIYLPGAGYYNNGYINENSGKRAILWTSTAHETTSEYAYYYSSGYNNNASEIKTLSGWYRNSGMPIRPVARYNYTLDDQSMIQMTTEGVDWEVGQGTATLHGYLLGLRYNSQATASGIAYSTDHISDDADDQTPGVEFLSTNNGEIANVASGNFTVLQAVVRPNTVYYYRTYVVVGGKYYYANEREFGRRMVKLFEDSDILWSNINMGASSIDDGGDYYAWGETETKSEFTKANYTYTGNLEDIAGSSNDVAHVKWGGLWTMPTKADLEELINRCTWTEVTKYGQPMYKLVGDTGDSLFIIKSGSKSDQSSKVYMWTSNLNATEGVNSETAYSSNFFENTRTIDAVSRYLGYTVRPVVKYTHTLADDTKIYLTTDSTNWQVGERHPRLVGSVAGLDALEADPNVTITRGFVVGFKDYIDVTTPNISDTEHVTNISVTTIDDNNSAVFRGTTTYDKDTTYYYRAYVKVGDDYYFGNVRRYGLEKIDLGFGGMLWASINMGAQYDACIGDRYAWGEMTVKSNYSQSSYKYYDNGYEFLGDSISGTRYDVAKAKWDDDWRMPTRREMQMLVDSCDWQWTTVDGQNGYLLTSKKNQHKLFLPAAGYQSTTFYNAVGDECYYWTATRNGDAQADILHADGSSYLVSAANRFLGISVRPVKKAVPDEPGKGITGGHQHGGAQQTETNQDTVTGKAGTGNTGGTVTPN